MILLGLDALEISELRPRLADGRLPNLARLLGDHPLRPVRPDVPGFPDGVWRSFVNGRPVGEHGWYFLKQWRPEHGRVERSDASWLRLAPFWSELAAAGARIALLDVPQAHDPGPAFPGIHLTGWQTHDPEESTSRPASLLGEIESRFGRRHLPREVYGRQSPAAMLALRHAAIAAIAQFAGIVVWLLQRERFDLLLAVFGTAHRVGHYLWDLSQLDVRHLAADERSALTGALDAVYEALDEAVGRITAAAPAGTPLVAFALHGMGPNPGWTELLPQLLPRLPGARIGRSRPAWRSRVDRLRRSSMVMRVSQALPRAATRLVGRAWTARMHDWQATRAFALPAEIGGLVRINLKGRDRDGIVEPGADYAALLASLEASLGAITALDDDLPLVARSCRPLEIVGDAAPYRAYLPDLVTQWRELSLSASEGLRLPDSSVLRWPRGRALTSGRSGNHRPTGWLIGAGSLNLAGGEDPSVVDLVQGVCSRFGRLLAS